MTCPADQKWPRSFIHPHKLIESLQRLVGLQFLQCLVTFVMKNFGVRHVCISFWSCVSSFSIRKQTYPDFQLLKYMFSMCLVFLVHLHVAHCVCAEYLFAYCLLFMGKCCFKTVKLCIYLRWHFPYLTIILLHSVNSGWEGFKCFCHDKTLEFGCRGLCRELGGAGHHLTLSSSPMEVEAQKKLGFYEFGGWETSEAMWETRTSISFNIPMNKME